MSSAKKMAREILQSIQRTYTRPGHIVLASESRFSHLNFAAYASLNDEFAQIGFRPLVDVEFKEASDDPDAAIRPTLVRCMTSQRGDTIALFYQSRPSIKWVLGQAFQLLAAFRWVKSVCILRFIWQSRFIVDLESEFSDGSFVVTSNQESLGILKWDMIDQQCFAKGTRPGILFPAHAARLSRIRRAKECELTAVNTKEKFLALKERMKRYKRAYRTENGWITSEELVKMVGGDAQLSEAVYKEIQALLRKKS